MKIKIRLHHLTFLAFTIISSVPVFFLATWVQHSALDKEIQNVQEKHLLVADNVTRALSRYINDAESIFRLTAANMLKKNNMENIPELLNSINFHHVCHTNQHGEIFAMISDQSLQPPQRIPPQVLATLKPFIDQALAKPNSVLFTPLLRDGKGVPRIFVLTAEDQDNIILGILATTYIQNIQQSISFGERGHAAVVDNIGQVIAHPKKAWQDSMKNISQLKPVQLMMQGKTGATQFYSPPMQANMIVGYTSVPQTGWGVMIPQPFQELQDRAQDVRLVALAITLMGIAVAGIISWFLAGFMSGPILAVVQSALKVPQSNQLKKVDYHLKQYLPQELQKLISAFNQMVAQLHNSRRVMEETSARLEEAQRIANLGHWEWDIERDKLWCSKEFFRICNISANDFSGQYLSLVDLIHLEDQELFQQSIDSVRKQGEHFSIDHRIVLPDKEVRYVHHEGKSLYRDKEQHLVGIIHDITERKIHENKLFHQANFDSLTGLPNRSLFFDRLTQALIVSQRHKQNNALLFIDLDNFKDINDSYGHIIGDQLLTQAAARLLSCVRKGDTVARFGGDEFIIILNNVTHGEDAAIIAKKVLARITTPFQLQNIEAFISASIGITISPQDANDSVALLRNADIALYRAKAAGRNTFCFYTNAMDQEVINRTRLGNELRRATEQQELEIYYQPIIDLQSGKISSAEALLRWQHQEQGQISPAEFIPIAEETGIIEPLGKWVLNQACQEAKKWHELVEDAPSVSINLSMQQLKLGLSTEDIKDILQQSQLDPKKLSLEITESMFMDDINDTVRWMNQIKNLGISFSVDDFGTGYSSLSYLKQLPVNVLKIDRAFVIDSTKKSDDAMLVRTIIAIGKSLNLKVVAEGVEEEPQVIYLKRLHCDCVQGYYYSKPLPGIAFMEFLSNWDPNRVHIDKKLVVGSV